MGYLLETEGTWTKAKTGFLVLVSLIALGGPLVYIAIVADPALKKDSEQQEATVIRIKNGQRLPILDAHLFYAGSKGDAFLMLRAGKPTGKELSFEIKDVPNRSGPYWEVNLLEEIGVPSRILIIRATDEEMDCVITS